MRVLALVCFWLTAARVFASTLTPPVLPLFVRNPYLNAWLGNAREPPWKHWPMFWTGQSLGLSVMARATNADDVVFPLLGRPQDSLPSSPEHYSIREPEYLGVSYDASTTNFTYKVTELLSDVNETALITLSFVSAMTPTSIRRQSLPASYLAISAEGDVALDIYVDINGDWVTGSRDKEIRWDLKTSKDQRVTRTGHPAIKTWRVSREHEQILSEINDRGEWGTLHFTGPSSASHQAGNATKLRQRFAQRGNLSDHVDSLVGTVMSPLQKITSSSRSAVEDEPVFAFSRHLDLSRSPSSTGGGYDSVLFSLALVQDPVVQFASARGLTLMRPLWRSYYSSTDAMIRHHYDDYQATGILAQDYSDQLALDARASDSQDYQDTVALSARQVMGATVFSGTPEDPILFLKEISSNGNFQTVDVIFPAFPFFLYTNPDWLQYLLEPLLEHMESGQYPNNYSMHDLGAHFPNATGHPDGNDEYMPVEECGDMLIMALALAHALKDKAQSSTLPEDGQIHDGSHRARKWLSRSYKLWKQWAGYLVRESLVPANQLSTDDFAGRLANQTNLALKGIIGIRAMSEVAHILGEKSDARHYSKIAEEYISKWQDFALSRDGSHTKLAYTWYGSWSTLYNLYADSLLCFRAPSRTATARISEPGGGLQSSNRVPSQLEAGFVPNKIYKIQSDWYHAVLQRYGLPLDSRHLYTKSDWEFFAAAVSSNATRREMIRSVARWINETTTVKDRPFTDLYETEGTGGWPGPHFKARPVVGGHFAPLALERACGGKARESLSFLDDMDSAPTIDATRAMDDDRRAPGPEGRSDSLDL